jgi:hypothetical protein
MVVVTAFSLLDIKWLQKKEMNNYEYEALLMPKQARLNHFGNQPKPIPIEFVIDNVTHVHTEWLDMHYATNCLDKLTLAANLYLHLNRAWHQIVKPSQLRQCYSDLKAIFSCITLCCNNDLVKFQDQWQTRHFCHTGFCPKICPAGDQDGIQCGFNKAGPNHASNEVPI